MILAYVIISSEGLLVYHKFFSEIKKDESELSLFAGGITAIQSFVKEILNKNIDSIKAGDWVVTIIHSDKFKVLIMATAANNMAKGIAKKIRDIIKPILDNYNGIIDNLLEKKIKDILSSKIDNEINEINKSFSSIHYI